MLPASHTNPNVTAGTDEYGTTSEARALAEKCTPQELCDKYHLIHAAVYRWFNIGFDIFGRTTTKLQTDITQDIFLKLNDNGFLDERTTTQLYCQEHNSFLADRFVEGECPWCSAPDARGDQCDSCGRLLEVLDLKNPRCKLDGSTPITKDTTHIFFRLDELQPEIDAFFRESSTNGAWSSNAIDITAAWLKQGLQARSITRDMKWGTAVPLPGFKKKLFTLGLMLRLATFQLLPTTRTSGNFGGGILKTSSYINLWERTMLSFTLLSFPPLKSVPGIAG